MFSEHVSDIQYDFHCSTYRGLRGASGCFSKFYDDHKVRSQIHSVYQSQVSVACNPQTFYDAGQWRGTRLLARMLQIHCRFQPGGLCDSIVSNIVGSPYCTGIKHLLYTTTTCRLTAKSQLRYRVVVVHRAFFHYVIRTWASLWRADSSYRLTCC